MKKNLREKKGDAIASLQRGTLYSATGMREATGTPLGTTIDKLTRIREGHPLKCTKEYVDHKPMYSVPETFTSSAYVKWALSREAKVKKDLGKKVASTMPLADYSPEVVAAIEAITALAKRNSDLELTIRKLRGALENV